MKKCKVCWQPRDHDNPLVSRCKKCQYEHSNNNKKQTRINLVSDKKKERIKNWWSEVELFRKILIERQNNWYLNCSICWKSFLIENAWPTSFAHILSKGQHPAYRLFENNIKIVCNDISINSCHTKLDEIINKIKKDIWHKQFENLIASWEDVQNLIDTHK